MSGRLRATATVALAFVVAAIPPAHAAPAPASTPATAKTHVVQGSDSLARSPSSLSVTVRRIDGTVLPDGVLRLRVQVTNRSLRDREGLRVVATLQQRTRSRFEYQQAVDAGVLGTVVHAFAADLGEVPARGSRTLDLEQSAQELGLARIEGLEGVYPLRLQVLAGDEVAAEVVTSVVASPAAVGTPLATAFLVTLDHRPSRDADGVFTDLGLLTALESGGHLRDSLDLLLARGPIPVTVAIDAHTLEEVADLAAGFLVRTDGRPVVYPASSPEAERARAFLAELREVVAHPDIELLALPYATADLVALVRGGLATEASRHLADGVRALELATGRRPSDEVLLPPDGITGEALLYSVSTGVRAVILSPAEVTLPPITGLTPSSLRRLRSGFGTSVPAIVDDPWLGPTLERVHSSPALAAQRVLSELATIYFERPNRRGRGILLRLPPGQPELLAAVASSPFATALTVSDFRTAVNEESDLVRLAYPVDAAQRELSSEYVAALRQARHALGSLEGVLVDDRATPGRFDRVLLQAASTHYRPGRDEGAGLALLRAVTSTVEQLYSTVVVPETPAVTLTSLEGELPVTVRSTAAVPLRVRVHLRTARLAVEGGPTREIVLEPDSTHVLMLPVRALNPGGTAPVSVQVTDVDGTVVLASGQVVVRSTALSVSAVLVVAGAALFLLVWWLQELTRRRRRRRSSGTPGPTTQSGGRRTVETALARPDVTTRTRDA